MRRDPKLKALQWIVGGSASASAFLVAAGIILPQVAVQPVSADTVAPGQTINRSAKQGVLQASQRSVVRDVVTSIEVIGLRESTIVYRDRQGKELFRTEPLANRTVVFKDVALPQVTIRETIGSPSETYVIDSTGKAEPTPQPVQETEKLAPSGDPMRIGCEPSVSPATAPAMQNIASRCLASIDIPQRVASN